MGHLMTREQNILAVASHASLSIPLKACQPWLISVYTILGFKGLVRPIISEESATTNTAPSEERQILSDQINIFQEISLLI